MIELNATPAANTDEDFKLVLAGWIAVAGMHGAYLSNDLVNWSSKVLKGNKTPTPQLTRDVIRKLEGQS